MSLYCSLRDRLERVVRALERPTEVLLLLEKSRVSGSGRSTPISGKSSVRLLSRPCGFPGPCGGSGASMIAWWLGE